MNQEIVEQKLIELALELYKDVKGAEEYQKLLELLDSNPSSADEILFDFINKNKDFLIRETKADLIVLNNQK